MKPRPPLLPALVLIAGLPFSGSILFASAETAPDSPPAPATAPAAPAVSPAPSTPDTAPKSAPEKPVPPGAPPAPAPVVPGSAAPAAPSQSPAAPAASDPAKTDPARKPDAEPSKPGTPVEPPRLFDGGAPVDAAEFQGVIKGCVETIGQHQASFRIKITCAQPNALSKAKKPESLVSSVVLVLQGADKGTDGKWKAKPGHHEWVVSLQPGSFVSVPVRYAKAANGFRMTDVPSPAVPPEGCGPMPAVAAGDGPARR